MLYKPFTNNLLRWPFLFTTCVIFLLVLLKPFGINFESFNIYFFFLIVGYGVVGFIPVMVYETPSVKSIFFKSRSSFIYGSILLLFVISILVWQYGNLLHLLEPKFGFPSFSFYKALISTYTIGVFPLAIRGAYLFSEKKQHPQKLFSFFPQIEKIG